MTPTVYGPGGPPATLTPSGQSMLSGNYISRTPNPVILALPATVPTTAYVPPAKFPAGVGPTYIQPPGPLGPISFPQIWPDVIPGSPPG